MINATTPRVDGFDTAPLVRRIDGLFSGVLEPPAATRVLPAVRPVRRPAMTLLDVATHLLFSLCMTLGLTILALVVLYQTELRRPDANPARCDTLGTPLAVDCYHQFPEVTRATGR